MARIFQVNGSDYDYLTSPNWQDQLDSAGLDGYSPALRWRRLTARGVVMPMADYVALKALEGSKVRVTCPPYDDRNADYQQYFGVDFEGITGSHEGPNMADVVCEFAVLV